jgi:hypothetical protein
MSMFTWISKQGVRSSDGFEVESSGRFTIEYREGQQVLTVEVENGNYGGGPSVSIARDAFAYWDGLRTENSPLQQAKMRSNFIAAMRFQDVNVEP